MNDIQCKEKVKVIAAVESGSRAWGFESPDSDYDVRFLYMRRLDDYLCLGQFKDTLEVELNDVYDINGWDVKKAFQLMHRSNPTLIEWCNSPIIYLETPEFSIIREMANEYFSPKKTILHYVSMALSNNRFLSGEQVRAKKYLYVLRPLLAAQWIAERKCPPPMLIGDLMGQELPHMVRKELERLVEEKKTLSEAETIPHILALDSFINTAMERLDSVGKEMQEVRKEWGPLNRAFAQMAKGYEI